MKPLVDGRHTTDCIMLVESMNAIWDKMKNAPWWSMLSFSKNPPSFIPDMGAAVPGGCPYCSKGPGAEHERGCRFKGHVPPLGGQK